MCHFRARKCALQANEMPKAQKNKNPKMSKARANATSHFEITQALRKEPKIFAKN
jgi:hypothetical protein